MPWETQCIFCPYSEFGAKFSSIGTFGSVQKSYYSMQRVQLRSFDSMNQKSEVKWDKLNYWVQSLDAIR